MCVFLFPGDVMQDMNTTAFLFISYDFLFVSPSFSPLCLPTTDATSIKRKNIFNL